MQSLIVLGHVLAAIAIICLVLMQRGKGAEMGASFGSGASQTLFGSGGSGNVLTKATTICAVIFFVTSLSLAVVARQQADMGVAESGLISDSEALQESGGATQADEDVPQVAPEEEEQSGSDVPDVPVE